MGKDVKDCIPEHWVRVSVAEFETKRLPADQRHTVCPACGFNTFSDIGLGKRERTEFTYRTTRLTRARGGDTIDVSTVGEHDPHLRVVCHCGFWWEREISHA